MKQIWVLPQIRDTDEIGKVSLGLLFEAKAIADSIRGEVTTLIFGEEHRDYSEVLGQYGVAKAYIFIDPLLKYPSADAYAAALLDVLKTEKPWLLLMGNTALGKELAPRLAGLLNTGAVTDCVKIDLSQPENPRFYRPVYGEQLYQEVVFNYGDTMIVTINPGVLDISVSKNPGKVITRIIEPKISPESKRIEHIEFLPADYKSVDVSEAETIIAAGMGAATDELFPMVEELAGLLEGAIGTTRPVVDGGKVPRERLIGQTGKVVSPDFYLALGVSGASHHIGGIQESGKIISVNRDPQAPIFQSSDACVVADLKEVLPILIEKIKSEKGHSATTHPSTSSLRCDEVEPR